MGKRIYAAYGSDPAGMARTLLEAGVGRSAPSGATISLKPNLVVARPASEGATTHPEIVAGVIEYFRDLGHRDVEIIEGSWLGDDTRRAFSVCGMETLAKRYGVRLFDLKRDETVTRDTPAGKIRLCRKAAEADFLVNLPVLKGHCQTRMTCALKNMKGCIPDSEKRRFHSAGLDVWIAALATALRPAVTLVDGICGDLDFEEGGNPVQADRTLLGADPVKLDAYVCALMGLEVGEVEYLVLAERYGVGSIAIGGDDVVELNRPGSGARPKPGGKVKRLAACLEAREACSACFANAVHAVGRLREDRRERFRPLHIGQGWKGMRGKGVGIGACCAGFDISVPGCPPTASAIVEALSGNPG